MIGDNILETSRHSKRIPPGFRLEPKDSFLHSVANQDAMMGRGGGIEQIEATE